MREATKQPQTTGENMLKYKDDIKFDLQNNKFLLEQVEHSKRSVNIDIENAIAEIKAKAGYNDILKAIASHKGKIKRLEADISNCNEHGFLNTLI